MRHIDLSRVGAASSVWLVRLLRPERRNALSVRMAEELLEAARDVGEHAARSECRALVLTGDERAFSAGRDLRASQELQSQTDQERYLELAFQSVLAMRDVPVPTVAAVSGACFGWGAELALACDMRVVHPRSTVCFPECALGIFPGAAGVLLMTQRLTAGVAADLLFTSRRIDGQEAHAIGFASHVQDDPLEHGLEIAEQIASNGPLGVRAAKKLMRTLQDMSAGGERRAEEESMARRKELLDTEDFRAALDAFARKAGKPNFNGS